MPSPCLVYVLSFLAISPPLSCIVQAKSLYFAHEPTWQGQADRVFYETLLEQKPERCVECMGGGRGRDARNFVNSAHGTPLQIRLARDVRKSRKILVRILFYPNFCVTKQIRYGVGWCCVLGGKLLQSCVFVRPHGNLRPYIPNSYLLYCLELCAVR